MAAFNETSKAHQQAARYAASLDVYFEAHGLTRITMTEATTAIFGTSGTGSASAKHIIENCAVFGYLIITRAGKVKRLVERSAKPIPEEAMSAEDRAEHLRMDKITGRR